MSVLISLAEKVIDKWGWPIMMAITVIVVAWLQRKPLAHLISRVRKFKWLELSVPTDQVASSTASVVEQMLTEATGPTVTDAEAAIKRQLEVLKSSAEREFYLTRHLAVSLTINSFLSLYMDLFGSQITALFLINGTADIGMPTVELQAVYDAARNGFPEIHATRTFEQWLGYLVEIGFVERKTESVKTTDLGREFMRWLVGSRRPPLKYG